MVVLLVIYKPLYWPIARWRFPIATCCTDHAVNVCTSNCRVTNHIFFMHLSLDQFLFSWLPLKAALTDMDYVFVVLRREWISIDIIYSVHWGSVHTILDSEVPVRKRVHRIGLVCSHIRSVISLWFLQRRESVPRRSWRWNVTGYQAGFSHSYSQCERVFGWKWKLISRSEDWNPLRRK